MSDRNETNGTGQFLGQCLLSLVVAIGGEEALADGSGAGGDVEQVTGRDDCLPVSYTHLTLPTILRV